MSGVRKFKRLSHPERRIVEDYLKLHVDSLIEEQLTRPALLERITAAVGFNVTWAHVLTICKGSPIDPAKIAKCRRRAVKPAPPEPASSEQEPANHIQRRFATQVAATQRQVKLLCEKTGLPWNADGIMDTDWLLAVAASKKVGPSTQEPPEALPERTPEVLPRTPRTPQTPPKSSKPVDTSVLVALIGSKLRPRITVLGEEFSLTTRGCRAVGAHLFNAGVEAEKWFYAENCASPEKYKSSFKHSIKQLVADGYAKAGGLPRKKS